MPGGIVSGPAVRDRVPDSDDWGLVVRPASGSQIILYGPNGNPVSVWQDGGVHSLQVGSEDILGVLRLMRLELKQIRMILESAFDISFMEEEDE